MTNTIDILRSGAIFYTLKLSSSMTRSQALLGKDEIAVDFIDSDFIDLQINDYIVYDGIQFNINTSPNIVKNSSNHYEHKVVFQSEYYDLAKAQFLSGESGEISDFFLSGDVTLFINLIRDNLNRALGGGWTTGTLNQTNTEIKNLQFQTENCLQAIHKVAQEFEGEFYFTGKAINFTDEVGTDIQRTFRYGRGNGLKKINRNNPDGQHIITRLYPYGSERNIQGDYRSEGDRSRRLKIGTGVNAYVENNKDTYGVIEASHIFEDIYPHREGTVTGINVANEKEFFDTGMDFDLNAQLLPGVTATVNFLTGSLSGFTFRVSAYDDVTKKFTIIEEQDDQGEVLPTTVLKPAINDKYVILDIQMPQTYITAAEAELLSKANEFLNVRSKPIVEYSCEFDPKYLRDEQLTVQLGDKFILFDEKLGVNELLRCIELNYPLHDPDAVKVKVANLISVDNLQNLFFQQRSANQSVSTLELQLKQEKIRVQTEDIEDLAIISGKIAAASISAAEIADLSITTTKIANSAITSGKIANLSVSASKIANNTITATQIASNTITASNIATNTITAGEIASNTITGGNILSNSITGGNIATGSITSGNLANQTITAGKIANLTITASQIANLTITGGATGKIAQNTISRDNIVANTITASEIAAGTITATQIAANTITANQLAVNSVTASEILAGSINASKIATDAITTDKIAANAVTSTEIAAGTVTANEIATNTITANELNANSVTASEIAADAVTADKINVTSLSAINADLGTITAGTITGITITGGTLRTATSGERCEIRGSDDRQEWYDVNGNSIALWYMTSSPSHPAGPLYGSRFELRGISQSGGAEKMRTLMTAADVLFYRDLATAGHLGVNYPSGYTILESKNNDLIMATNTNPSDIFIIPYNGAQQITVFKADGTLQTAGGIDLESSSNYTSGSGKGMKCRFTGGTLRLEAGDTTGSVQIVSPGNTTVIESEFFQIRDTGSTHRGTIYATTDQIKIVCVSNNRDLVLYDDGVLTLPNLSSEPAGRVGGICMHNGQLKYSNGTTWTSA